MIDLIFADGEYDHVDDNVIIFFETLKNHIEIFGYSVAIDLTGIALEKEEFDNILNIINEFIRNNKITKIINSDRQNQIEEYLGMLLKHDIERNIVDYCADNGYVECVNYLHENGCTSDEKICDIYAYNGKIELLKYAHKNGYKWDAITCRCATMNGHLDCLRYAHENGCDSDYLTCEYAATMGHLECLKYACENNFPLDINRCIMCAQSNCIEYLDNLQEQIASKISL